MAMIPYMAAGYVADRAMGGNGMTGTALATGIGAGTGFALPSFGGSLGTGATAANSLGGGATLMGGASTAAGTGVTTGATTGLVGSGIPTDGRVIPSAGIDLLSNHNAGLELGAGMESGLTEVGSNAGYQFGDPFYNTSESVMQNKNFITEDMFKPTNLDTMGLEIDDMGNVVDFNATDMELFQPIGTERELTMQDYSEKGVDKLDKMIDYAYENPAKILQGGLTAASLMERMNPNIPTQPVAGKISRQAYTPNKNRLLNIRRA